MRLNVRSFFSLIFLLSFSLNFTFAKKKDVSVSESLQKNDAEEDDYIPDSSLAVQLSVPEKKARPYFYSIPDDVLEYVEEGSPESLKKAYASLRRKSESFSEPEKTLFFVIVTVMQLCWQSENFKNDIQVSPEKSAYTGALESVKSGVYDYSTGKTDFLSRVLPSLILVTSSGRSDFYDDAEESLKSALTLNSESVLANYLYGLLMIRENDFSAAKKYFTRAVAVAPGVYEIQLALAQVDMKLNESSEAYDIAKKMLEKSPMNKTLLKICAESSFASGDLAGAEDYVGRVLQQEPNNTYFVLFRAKILIQKGEYIRAVSLLDAYARTDTRNRDYLYLRYRVQKEWNRDFSKATATLEEALRLYPADKEIVLAAALLCSETGSKINGKSSDELASEILALEPQNPLAMQIQILSLVKKKEWQKAYDLSSALISMKDFPQNALFTHISICISAEKKDEAWKIISKLYAEKPGDEDVLQAYIDVLVKTGRSSDALKLISDLLPSSNAKMKSFLYYQKSFISASDDAVFSDLRSSLIANPRNKDAFFRLYSIYFDKREYRKAQYYLKQVIGISPNDESYRVLNQNLEKLISQ